MNSIIASKLFCLPAAVIAWCFCCSAALAAVPPTPASVRALPTYDANRNINVAWADVAGETGYQILRSDGGAFAEVGTVGPNVLQFVDNNPKDLSKTYSYQVVARNGDGDSAPSATFATAVAVTWPMGNGSHQLFQGFADGSPNSSLKFHEGLDIPGTGALNTVAARAGKVIGRQNPPAASPTQGIVIVEVDVGGGVKEYDTYIHLDTIGVAVNEFVPEGKVLATKMGDFGDGGASDHLHFSVTRNDVLALIAAGDGVNFEKTWLNPLPRFTRNADRDPLQKNPGLNDSNGDGFTILLAPSGRTVPPGNFSNVTKEPVRGDIDIIADVRDQMHDTFLQSAAPNQVGYYVRNLFEIGLDPRNLRVAADPYVLAKFDDNWFNDRPFNAGAFTAVYADDGTAASPGDPEFEQDLRLDSFDNDTLFPFTKHYTLTNTKGNNGRLANVDRDQYWNTNARNIASRSDTDARANFAGDPDAIHNAQSRFRDGDYEIHVTIADLVNPARDVAAGRVRLDNFPQTSSPHIGGLPTPPAGNVDQLYQPGNPTPMLTEFDPETADITPVFAVGDLIGVLGEEYIPNLLMRAWIFPHQAEWLNGDAFPAPIAVNYVMSDADGVLPLTRLWTANMSGEFDLIVDYDRDEMFSATLDGLSGFTVVPEPAAWLLLAVGGLAVYRVRRSRVTARLIR